MLADAASRRSPHASRMDDLARGLALQQRHSLGEAWGTLLAVETALREVCDEFESDEVVPEELERALAVTRDLLDEFTAAGERFFEPLEPPAGSGELLGLLRQSIRRDERRFS